MNHRVDQLFDRVIEFEKLLSSSNKRLIKHYVIVNLQVEGIHNFPKAEQIFPEVGFLSSPHRHIFHIKVCCPVTHTNRDKEFIMLKREVIQYLNEIYYSEIVNMLDFENKSCEMIAEDLLCKFDAKYVEVFEDGENGARVEI